MERERRSFWWFIGFHWLCCCRLAVATGPVVMTTCAPRCPCWSRVLGVRGFPHLDFQVTIFFTWHACVCLHSQPLFQSTSTLSRELGLLALATHTLPQPWKTKLCGAHILAQTSWWLTLLSVLFCLLLAHVSWNILSCQRGASNAAGKDQTFLSPLLPDLYAKATCYPMEYLSLGPGRSRNAFPTVAGTNLPVIP